MKNGENAEVEASGKQEAREEAVGTEELAGSGARGKDEVSVEEVASDGDLLEALQTLMKNDFIVQHGNETTGAAKVCNLTMHKLNVQNVLPGVAVELGLTIAKVSARFFRCGCAGAARLIFPLFHTVAREAPSRIQHIRERHPPPLE